MSDVDHHPNSLLDFTCSTDRVRRLMKTHLRNLSALMRTLPGKNFLLPTVARAPIHEQPLYSVLIGGEHMR